MGSKTTFRMLNSLWTFRYINMKVLRWSPFAASRFFSLHAPKKLRKAVGSCLVCRFRKLW